ncbi:MAG: hypothetical protein WC678_04985 [Parcubacteria group bacterium]|jgi:hypothetical protein
MGLTNFLLNRKIKKAERVGYDYYIRTAKAIEADSAKAGANRIDNEEFSKLNELLEQTLKGMGILEIIEQKYVQLKEKYKHDRQQLLNIVTDWRDFNILTYNLFSNTGDKTEHEIRAEEMMERFDKLLDE